MADIDSRSAAILRFLTKSTSPVSSEEISRQVGLTPRAVRYRIPQISAWLRNAGAEFVHKPRYGVFINASTERKEKLYGQVISHAFFYSPNDRIYLILLTLLSKTEPVIIKQLVSLLSVSRSTIVQDLHGAEEWLQDHGLRLASKPNRGFWVEGEEADYREALLSCVLNGARDIGFQDELLC